LLHLLTKPPLFVAEPSLLIAALLCLLAEPGFQPTTRGSYRTRLTPDVSVGQHLGERGGRQHTPGPGLDLLDGRCRDAPLDLGIYCGAKALTQQAQQHRAFTLTEALLAALLDELLSGGHDGFLGVGADLAVEKRCQGFSFDMNVDLKNARSCPARRLAVTSAARAYTAPLPD